MELKKTVWAFDLDGVITANPQAISWLTFHLSKKENQQNEIYIVTWRDGTNKDREEDTIRQLKEFNISYHFLVMAPKHFNNIREASFWKIAKIHELGVNIWIDDEIKQYKRDLKLDLDFLLPEVNKIWI